MQTSTLVESLPLRGRQRKILDYNCRNQAITLKTLVWDSGVVNECNRDVTPITRRKPGLRRQQWRVEEGTMMPDVTLSKELFQGNQHFLAPPKDQTIRTQG
jgi:hypothetical protein